MTVYYIQDGHVVSQSAVAHPSHIMPSAIRVEHDTLPEGKEFTYENSVFSEVISTGNSVELHSPEYYAEVKRGIIQTDFESVVATIKSGYSEEEIKSWDKQEREARRYLVDNNADVPLLDAMTNGQTAVKAALASSIILKADQFAAAYGGALGEMHNRKDTLQDIDLGAVNAIALIEAV